MKKTIDIIIIILAFFIIYFLQTNFFTWFNIAGIMPNLFVVLIYYIIKRAKRCNNNVKFILQLCYKNIEKILNICYNTLDKKQ